MRLLILTIGALLLFSLGTQSYAQTPTIDIFSPTGEAKWVSQVKVRFNSNMSTLGDLRQDDPFEIDCSTKGKGRWVDPKNWVYEFSPRLAAGNHCTFTPLPGLRDIKGNRVRGNKSYSFNTGGPAVRYTRPYDGNSSLSEDQYFEFLLDGEADKDSVQQLSWCEVEGIAEKIPVQVLDTPEGKRDNAISIWLKCQNALPSATKVRLVWEKGIRSTSGIATTSRQSFDYKVRPPFTANFTCTRSSIKQPCSPLSDFTLYFSSSISLEAARKITLQQEDQDKILAKVEEDSERGDTRYVSFKGPFAENTDFEISLPTDIKDDAARPLKNAKSFPLSFSTGSFPPLIKFSGDFGILEHKTGGVLPVSIRGVEAPLSNLAINISSNADFIKTKDPFEILDWMEKVRRVQWGQLQQENGNWEYMKDDPRPSVFKGQDQLDSFTMPETLGDKALEVIGIPLKEPGFYVVELSSQILGDALNEKKTRYHVATSALVTNMAVHFLWGDQSSAVWVTYLDSGLPVLGAQVQVGNECNKQILWSGTTGKDGVAMIGNDIPSGSSWSSCNNKENPPLIITANKGKDFSFSRTKWNDGLSPWEFGLDSYYYNDDPIKVHTVLDRSLFRAGETLSMKHFVRKTTATGFGLYDKMPDGIHVVLVHDNSDQKYKFPIQFDEFGRAQNQWKIPKDAKLGSYSVVIAHKGGILGTAAEFRIEEFKIPMMQAFLTGPAKPVIAKDKLQVTALVRYLSGGGASGKEVRIISELQNDWGKFDKWEDYTFDYRNIVVGTFKRGEQIGEKEPSFNSENSLKLDANGSANVTIFNLPKINKRRVLRTELEYQDANGEFLTKTTNTKLWPAALALGIKTEGWTAKEDDLKFSVLAIGTDEKPIAGQQVAIKLYQEKNLSWRKRMIGGYYSYENELQVSLLDDNCSGKTDRNGRLFCKLKPGISGNVLLQASATDKDGNSTTSTKSVWLVGEDSWWFDQQQSDRMDLLVESVDLEGGDMARIQVRSPFRSATALVTIQREGVIDTFITNISGSNPVIEVPIKGEYAPNIYVSVIAVRGRIGGFRSWLAEMAREYDLPWLSRDGGKATGL
ncbi:MAG: hypothetical protein JKY46_02530, partial [Robiginitomaculum sp.]|nr:hypothetical protein [Robiginitomaculum sp.]